MVDVLFLLEVAEAEVGLSPGVRNREALASCQEALQLVRLGNVDSKTIVEALARAATRSATEGLTEQSADYLREAIRVGENAGLSVGWLRENLLYGHLCSSNIPAALDEVESWQSWPLDDIGLWLLVETFFQSRRLECVPILHRMLRTRAERDELSVRKMEDMLAIARGWS